MTGQAQGGLGGGALVPGETQADGCEWDPRVVRSGHLVYLHYLVVQIVSDPSERMLAFNSTWVGSCATQTKLCFGQRMFDRDGQLQPGLLCRLNSI